MGNRMEVSPNIFLIFDTVDGSRGFYAKWNESDRERQIPYDLPNDADTKTNQEIKKQNNRLIYRETNAVISVGEWGRGMAERNERK